MEGGLAVGGGGERDAAHVARRAEIAAGKRAASSDSEVDECPFARTKRLRLAAEQLVRGVPGDVDAEAVASGLLLLWAEASAVASSRAAEEGLERDPRIGAVCHAHLNPEIDAIIQALRSDGNQANVNVAEQLLHNADSLGLMLAQLLGHAAADPEALEDFAANEGVGENAVPVGPPSSFIKAFGGYFVNHMNCTFRFSQDNIAMVGAVAFIQGESGVHLVGMHYEYGRFQFRQGWAEFVEHERIVFGDVGHFQLDGPNSFLMTLYDYNGDHKPLAQRPQPWSVELAYGAGPAFGYPAHVHANIIGWVPDEEAHYGMDYIAGPGVSPSDQLLDEMYAVWSVFQLHYPLYPVLMKRTYTQRGTFMFDRKYSVVLPQFQCNCKLYYGAIDLPVEARYARTQDGQNGMINRGWMQFVRTWNIVEGEYYVFAVQNTEAGLLVRIFHV